MEKINNENFKSFLEKIDYDSMINGRSKLELNNCILELQKILNINNCLHQVYPDGDGEILFIQNEDFEYLKLIDSSLNSGVKECNNDPVFEDDKDVNFDGRGEVINRDCYYGLIKDKIAINLLSDYNFLDSKMGNIIEKIYDGMGKEICGTDNYGKIGRAHV